MNTDERIRSEIQKALGQKMESGKDVQIEVKEGVVTLSGYTENFADQMACEEAAQRTQGVVGVVQNIHLRLPSDAVDEDVEIARKCKLAIELNRYVPSERLKIVVKDRCVFLKGEADSSGQRREAEATILRVPGIHVIKNEVEVKPGLKAADIHQEILTAFKHMVCHHAKEIRVDIEGESVVLSGMARAWVEIIEAERVVRDLPGIREVINRIELTPLLRGKESPPQRPGSR